MDHGTFVQHEQAPNAVGKHSRAVLIRLYLIGPPRRPVDHKSSEMKTVLTSEDSCINRTGRQGRLFDSVVLE